ncbi:hypothetical protein [Streptococcus equinus]|uniref:hypothetical protein n=1 Tax=Streptococcus equinus TaxID=1335 RepID=UPI00115623A7|nr:hypothetical protein [Streptococcus equinus]
MKWIEHFLVSVIKNIKYHLIKEKMMVQSISTAQHSTAQHSTAQVNDTFFLVYIKTPSNLNFGGVF